MISLKRKITIFLTVVKVATIRDILMNGVFEDFRFDVHFVIFTHFKLSSELTSLFNGYSVEFIKIPPANTDSFKIQFFRKIRTFIYHL
ncbi:MAG: hypothetical protein KC535_05405, partial [Nanoarchaeota archaeon]|nr:hypothetical protein [Nanoarchaeota archaeon]